MSIHLLFSVIVPNIIQHSIDTYLIHTALYYLSLIETFDQHMSTNTTNEESIWITIVVNKYGDTFENNGIQPKTLNCVKMSVKTSVSGLFSTGMLETNEIGNESWPFTSKREVCVSDRDVRNNREIYIMLGKTMKQTEYTKEGRRQWY